MSDWTGTGINGEDIFGCPPAMGISFASGTTDGPGALEHGMNWDYVNENYNGQGSGSANQKQQCDPVENEAVSGSLDKIGLDLKSVTF